MGPKTLLFLSLFSQILSRCAPEDPNSPPQSPSYCAMQSVSFDEIEFDCYVYTPDDPTCTLYHLSDYMCCYTYYEIPGQFYHNNCKHWRRRDIQDGRISDTIKMLENGSFGVNFNVYVLDCGKKFVNTKQIWRWILMYLIFIYAV